jgi:hypothetical protein
MKWVTMSRSQPVRTTTASTAVFWASISVLAPHRRPAPRAPNRRMTKTCPIPGICGYTRITPAQAPPQPRAGLLAGKSCVRLP